MSLTFIDTNKLNRQTMPSSGAFTEVLNERLCGAKNVLGTLRWLGSGDVFRAGASRKHQLIYVMEGAGIIRLDDRDYEVKKGAGVYLEPDEAAEIRAGSPGTMKLFHLEVPHIPGG